jgi:hypothetical protein
LDSTGYNLRLKIFALEPFALFIHDFFYSANMRQKRVRYNAKPVLTHESSSLIFPSINNLNKVMVKPQRASLRAKTAIKTEEKV